MRPFSWDLSAKWPNVSKQHHRGAHILTGLKFMVQYDACCYLPKYLACLPAQPNKIAEPPLVSFLSVFLSVLISLCLFLCRAATTQDIQWWWTRWSMTFTSSPAASSTPRSPLSLVCNADRCARHLLTHNYAQAYFLRPSFLAIFLTDWLRIL